jgi:hypothetical protein
MARCKSWGLTLFVVLSVALFVAPIGTDDLEGVPKGVQVQVVRVGNGPEIKAIAFSAPITGVRHAHANRRSDRQQSANLLDLVCVRLC